MARRLSPYAPYALIALLRMSLLLGLECINFNGLKTPDYRRPPSAIVLQECRWSNTDIILKCWWQSTEDYCNEQSCLLLTIAHFPDTQMQVFSTLAKNATNGSQNVWMQTVKLSPPCKKKLSYCRGTTRRAGSVKTVLNVAQMFFELLLISPALGKWPSAFFEVIRNGTNR